MYHEQSSNGFLHYVKDEDGFILKVFGTKEKCLEYIRDNK